MSYKIQYKPSPNSCKSYESMMAEIIFDGPPNPNRYLEACSEAKNKCPEYKNKITGHRHIWTSTDKLTVTIRIVDVLAEIEESKKIDSNYHIVEITLCCNYCKSEYIVWELLPKKHFDGTFQYKHIPYCPKCPPISNIQEWFIANHYLPEKPEYFEGKPIDPELFADLDDLEL